MSSSMKMTSRKTSRSQFGILLTRNRLLTRFIRRITALTDAKVEFGKIPREHWFQPDWIDEEKATKSREDMVKNQVIYGGMSAICIFYSRAYF